MGDEVGGPAAFVRATAFFDMLKKTKATIITL